MQIPFKQVRTFFSQRPFIILFILFGVLSMRVYLNRRVGWSGVRYENYEDGKPKKKLTYGFGAKLIKVENFDRQGKVISVESF